MGRWRIKRWLCWSIMLEKMPYFEKKICAKTCCWARNPAVFRLACLTMRTREKADFQPLVICKSIFGDSPVLLWVRTVQLWGSSQLSVEFHRWNKRTGDIQRVIAFLASRAALAGMFLCINTSKKELVPSAWSALCLKVLGGIFVSWLERCPLQEHHTGSVSHGTWFSFPSKMMQRISDFCYSIF